MVYPTKSESNYDIDNVLQLSDKEANKLLHANIALVDLDNDFNPVPPRPWNGEAEYKILTQQARCAKYPTFDVEFRTVNVRRARIMYCVARTHAFWFQVMYRMLCIRGVKCYRASQVEKRENVKKALQDWEQKIRHVHQLAWDWQVELFKLTHEIDDTFTAAYGRETTLKWGDW
ncbi:MAG: hypothetical protein Q9222_003774 [Ikaeria aurantiellina]